MRQGCSYTVECLLSKLENLGSILAITKKKTNVKYQQESILDPYGFFLGFAFLGVLVTFLLLR